jgi:hypothetical protein
VGIAALILLPLVGSLVSVGFGQSYDWRTAPRHSTGIAPDPAETPEAVVQVYAAHAFSWRAAFGVHTWIAVKRTDAPKFTVYEVIGWHVMHGGGSAVSISNRPPDGMWYGNAPEIIFDLRGDGVDDVIARIEQAVASYPYPDTYVVWPGPNSNTFTAYVARTVPELVLDLPPTAIGKDYPTNGGLVDQAPSGTGWQVSLFGLLGVMVAEEEGLEINVLGLTFGIDFNQPAIKLPGLGRLGLPLREKT